MAARCEDFNPQLPAIFLNGKSGGRVGAAQPVGEGQGGGSRRRVEEG